MKQKIDYIHYHLVKRGDIDKRRAVNLFQHYRLLRCVSKKTLIAYVASKHAAAVKDAMIKLPKPEKEHLHTITFDNAKKFAYHAKMKKVLSADNYFAPPYFS